MATVELSDNTMRRLREAADKEGKSIEELLDRVLSRREQECDDPRERYKGVLDPPASWPSHFRDFEPLRVEGEPVSEQLIRERR